jgi:hypothetical protein
MPMIGPDSVCVGSVKTGAATTSVIFVVAQFSHVNFLEFLKLNAQYRICAHWRYPHRSTKPSLTSNSLVFPPFLLIYKFSCARNLIGE